MKKQILLTIILFSFITSLNAQIRLYDIDNNNPISNAKIFSKDGRILSISDLNGEINISKVDFTKIDTIEIYHPSYISQKMTWHVLSSKSEIYLNPDPIIELEEVILTAKKPEYFVLKGYFISYQIIDDVALTFSDGIIEYYINLTKEKLVDTRIIESRTFRHIDSIKAFSKRKGNSTFNILSTIPPFSFEEEVLLSDWGKYEMEDGGIIKRKNDVVGKIIDYNDKSELTIEYYSPENTKKTSLLGITSVIKNKTMFEKFNSPIPEIEKITSLGKYYNSDITKKGVTINYELIQDFYTLENAYLSEEKYKSHLSEKVKNEQPNLFLENKTISVIPEFIELKLFNGLEIISNEK